MKICETNFRQCQQCRCYHSTVKRRRQHTAYENDESNFAVLCKSCQELQDEYWEERWSDLYMNLL